MWGKPHNWTESAQPQLSSCAWPGSRKGMNQCKALREDLTTISTRSPVKDLYGMMQGVVGSSRKTFHRTHKISLPSSENQHRATSRALRHAQSIPKSRQGCASDSKFRTMPQRERPDAHKVTRRLREHMLDFHKTLRSPRKMNIEHVKNDSQPLLCRGLRSTAPATKNEPEASEVLHLCETPSKFTKYWACHTK